MKIFGVGKLIVVLTMLVSVGWAQGLEGNFVGAAKNSKAFIAIVAAQGKVLAYICDGEKIAQWFRGTLGEGGAIAIELGSNKLNARLNAGIVSGTVEVGGEKLEFSATAATGNAGLFRTELSAGGSNYTGGWIIDQNGEQRGAVIGGGGFQASISELLLAGGEGTGGSLCSSVRVTNGRTASIPNVGRVAAWQVSPACIGAIR